MGSYVCLPSCVPLTSTILSKHGVGVEPLFCLGFWDRGRACAKGGGVAEYRAMKAVSRFERGCPVLVVVCVAHKLRPVSKLQ